MAKLKPKSFLPKTELGPVWDSAWTNKPRKVWTLAALVQTQPGPTKLVGPGSMNSPWLDQRAANPLLLQLQQVFDQLFVLKMSFYELF